MKLLFSEFQKLAGVHDAPHAIAEACLSVTFTDRTVTSPHQVEIELHPLEIFGPSSRHQLEEHGPRLP
jgi:hypothetical protein